MVFIDKWLKVYAAERNLALEFDEKLLAHETRLDRCYVIYTELGDEYVDP